MPIRPYQSSDARPLAALSAACARGESDFVLNPLWESEEELESELRRRGIEPEDHLRVAESEAGELAGVAGYLRAPDDTVAALVCPIVAREERGQGVGGELLRSALALGESLGIKLASAGVGTRNRAGYSLLTSVGFRPVRQVFLMRCDERPENTTPPAEGVEFAPADTADAAKLLEIYLECGFEERSLDAMRSAMIDGRHAHAVARRGGEVIAFAELQTHWPARPWVAYVGVSPELRARGLGSTLVAWSLARSFDTGARSALLILSPANREAVRAYEKVGFKRFRTVDVLELGL